MDSILLVEEDLKVLTSMASIFSNIDYQVFTARNPKDAIRHLRSSAPSIIISDFNLQNSSGLDLLNTVRNTLFFKSTPFIFLSDPSDNLIAKYKIDSYTDFITKPFLANDLINKVHDKLNKRKLAVKHAEEDNNNYRLNFSSEFYQIESHLALLNKHADKLSKEEIIDFISRIKIDYSKIKNKIEKQSYYNQLLLLQNNITTSKNISFNEKYDLNNLEIIAQKISKAEYRESDLALFIDQFEFKTNTELLNIVINEIIENSFKHSWAYSPVEIIAVDKDDEYIITFTNYSAKLPQLELDNPNKYGMKIIDEVCQILNVRFQITQVANNCVKSRLTINTNNH